MGILPTGSSSEPYQPALAVRENQVVPFDLPLLRDLCPIGKDRSTDFDASFTV